MHETTRLIGCHYIISADCGVQGASIRAINYDLSQAFEQRSVKPSVCSHSQWKCSFILSYHMIHLDAPCCSLSPMTRFTVLEREEADFVLSHLCIAAPISAGVGSAISQSLMSESYAKQSIYQLHLVTCLSFPDCQMNLSWRYACSSAYHLSGLSRFLS